MKMTDNECPECGDYSTARYSDGTIECLNCRTITHPSDFPDRYENWPRPKRSRNHLAAAPSSSLVEERPAPKAKPSQAVSEPLPSSCTTIHHFITIAGVSPRVDVVKEQYANGGIGLQLWDEDGPLLTATHWLPGIPEGCVAVKDYEENEGCLAQLIAKGVLGRPERFHNGYPICRVLF